MGLCRRGARRSLEKWEKRPPRVEKNFGALRAPIRARRRATGRESSRLEARHLGAPRRGDPTRLPGNPTRLPGLSPLLRIAFRRARTASAPPRDRTASATRAAFARGSRATPATTSPRRFSPATPAATANVRSRTTRTSKEARAVDRPPSAPTSVSISSGTYPTPVASFARRRLREIRPPFAAAQNDPANATEETSSRRLRTERRPRNLPPNVSERVLRKRTRRRNRRRKRRRRVLVLVESASSTSPPPPPPPPTRAEATSRGASAITVDSRTTFSRRNGADSARDENLPPRSPSPARASSRRARLSATSSYPPASGSAGYPRRLRSSSTYASAYPSRPSLSSPSLSSPTIPTPPPRPLLLSLLRSHSL